MVNRLERLIAYISPERAAKRAKARYMLSMLETATPRAKYEGGTKTYRTTGWTTSSRSADSEIRLYLPTLRERHRDLVRNNPYASRAISAISNNIVGDGITPHVINASVRETKNLEALLVDHFDSNACNSEENGNLYEIQRIIARAVAESGSCLIRRRRRSPSDNLPLPFQLQVLEPDYLDHSKDRDLGAEGKIVHGIQYNAIGKPVFYHLFRSHPGDQLSLSFNMDSDPIPASEIAHVYRVDRPGQSEGVPWGAPIIIRLRDFDDYEDAQLLRQKIAAAHVAFVYDDEFSPTGATANQSASTNPLVDKMEPGIIELLPPGKDVKFNSPPGVEGYKEYADVSLHAIAMGYEVPHATLTGDLSSVNYSSARMGRLDFMRNVSSWQQHIMISKALRKIESWFMESASIRFNRTLSATLRWAPPYVEMVDPSVDVPARRDAVRAGQRTLFEDIRRSGEDPERFLEEYKRVTEKLDELGLVLDSDPRVVSRQGALQGEAKSNSEPPEQQPDTPGQEDQEETESEEVAENA